MSKLSFALTLGLLCALHPGLMAHGGPPLTHDVLLSSGQLSLVTSHGFFNQDEGWTWVCEEATEGDLASGVVRTPQGWFVGTLYGLKTSNDSCTWRDEPSLLGQTVLEVFEDTLVPERVWVLTSEGLWALQGDGEAQHVDLEGRVIRSAGQNQEGQLLLVGFQGSEPFAWLDEQAIALPLKGGRMEVLGTDAQGRFYMRFPRGYRDSLVRVSESGSEVLIEDMALIRGFTALGANLYAFSRERLLWSSDDGVSWRSATSAPIGCLVEAPEGLYACPPLGSSAALFYAEAQSEDPDLWSWESYVEFDALSGSDCPAGSEVDNICPFIWASVIEELGMPPLELPLSEASPPSALSGCELGRGPAVGWVWCSVLFAFLSLRALARGRARA